MAKWKYTLFYENCILDKEKKTIFDNIKSKVQDPTFFNSFMMEVPIIWKRIL